MALRSGKAEASNPVIALLFYFFTVFTLHGTRGHYHAVGIVCWLLAFVGMTVLFVRGGASAWGRVGGRQIRLFLAIGLSASALLLIFRPLLMFASSQEWLPLLQIQLAGVLAASTFAICSELFPQAKLRASSELVLIVAIFLALGAKIVVTLISPNPAIDVFVINNLACDTLWAGRNPYTVVYPDIYDGKWGYVPVLPYPPGYLLWALPFRIGLGEVRMAQIFADAISAGALLLIARKCGASLVTSQLLALTWLVSPASLFVTEQAWIDPVIAAWSGLVFLSLSYRKFIFAGIALGMLCVVKQYGFVVGLGLLPWLIFGLPLKDVAKVLGCALTVALAIVVPFLAADPTSFLRSVVLFPTGTGVRLDAFSFAAFLGNELGVKPPKGFSTVVTSLALLLGFAWLWNRRGRALADAAGFVVITYGFAFFFGIHAFCNYYHILSYFVLLTLALRGAASLRTPLRF